MTTLDDGLTRYLTNATYVLWTHDTWCPGWHFTPKTYSFERNKQNVLNKIWRLNYTALCEKILFPNFVTYEDRVAQTVSAQVSAEWEKPVIIPKCDAFPEGESYRKCVIRLPKNLFHGIDGCFLQDIDCQITCIAPRQNEDVFFWHNLEWEYDRRATLNSWNGELLKIVKGRGTLIVGETMFHEDLLVRVVTAISSLLLSAYSDYTEISSHPDSYQYVHTHFGKTRYRHNLDTLLCQSEEPALRNVGDLIVKVAGIDKALKDPKKFSAPHSSVPEIERFAENSVDIVSKVYKKTAGYRQLKEMENLLNKTIPLIQSADERQICESWNRCVRQKVRTKEQLVESLRSKCQAVTQKSLTLLAMHFIKEKTSSSSRFVY